MARATSINALSYLQSRPLTPAATVAFHLVVVFVSWAERRKSSITLGDLDPHLLSDIGVTREEARRESERFFWQP